MTEAPGFYGYRRPDGRAGTRNHVLVVPTVICSAVVAERVAAAVTPVGVALPHLAGCGQLGPDMRVTHDTLAAYCGHPNVGAVVVVALGCLNWEIRRGSRDRGDDQRRGAEDAETLRGDLVDAIGPLRVSAFSPSLR
jgi:altronate dehydratase